VKRKRKLLIWLGAILAVLAILFGVCAVYVMNYYHADKDAIASFMPKSEITPHTLSDGSLVYEPNGALAGFIFYPGGKVEHTAYEPLMLALAEQGILCVLIEMPFRLAVLDIDAADGIQELFPNIDTWYIGGHSLGGAMAASYLSDHTTEFEGLVLLAAYASDSLKESGLQVLSIYGSKDRVLNMEKYAEYFQNLPNDTVECVIDGGNHAQFGSYGVQDGDGTAGISREEQLKLTVEAIVNRME
jgi:hypothetical protein